MGGVQVLWLTAECGKLYGLPSLVVHKLGRLLNYRPAVPALPTLANSPGGEGIEKDGHEVHPSQCPRPRGSWPDWLGGAGSRKTVTTQHAQVRITSRYPLTIFRRRTPNARETLC